MQDSRPKKVEALVEEFGLPSKSHFTCARIIHLLAKYPIPNPHAHPKAWKFYTATERGISFFFKTFYKTRTHSRKPIQC